MRAVTLKPDHHDDCRAIEYGDLLVRGGDADQDANCRVHSQPLAAPLLSAHEAEHSERGWKDHERLGHRKVALDDWRPKQKRDDDSDDQRARAPEQRERDKHRHRLCYENYERCDQVEREDSRSED